MHVPPQMTLGTIRVEDARTLPALFEDRCRRCPEAEAYRPVVSTPCRRSRMRTTRIRLRLPTRPPCSQEQLRTRLVRFR